MYMNAQAKRIEAKLDQIIALLEAMEATTATDAIVPPQAVGPVTVETVKTDAPKHKGGGKRPDVNWNS